MLTGSSSGVSPVASGSRTKANPYRDSSLRSDSGAEIRFKKRRRRNRESQRRSAPITIADPSDHDQPIQVIRLTEIRTLQQFMGHARFETTKAYIDEYDAEELALALRPRTAQEVPKGKSRVEKLLENAGGLVGDTGFEPVASTV